MSEEFFPKSWSAQLLKVLADKNAAQELKMLSQSGGLTKWSPELAKKIQTLPVDNISVILASESIPENASKPYILYSNLVGIASIAEQYRLADSLIKVAPDFVHNWIEKLNSTNNLC